MRQAVTGGAYQAHSVIASAQRSVNLFSEPLPENLGEPAKATDYPTPGIRLLSVIGGGPIRGVRQATNGACYVVSGSEVYSVNTTSWVGTSLGLITPGLTTPVSMQDNSLDLVIVDGTSSGWKVNLASNTMQPIVQSGVLHPATMTTVEPVQTDIARYTKFTPTFDGTVISVTVSLQTGYVGNLKCAIFEDTGGQPGLELVSAADRTNPTTGDNTFLFFDPPAIMPPTVIAGTSYWVGFDSDTGTGAWNVDGGGIGAYSHTVYAAFPANSPMVIAATPVVCSLAMESDPGGLFVGADRVDYLDEVLIFNKPNTPQFYWSLPLSVTFDPLAQDFINKDNYPDLVMTQIVAKREIWVIGERTTQIYYDKGQTGITEIRFDEVQSVFVDHGTVAKYSVAGYDNGVFWITRDRQGQGFVVMGAGYQTKRVSTYAIEAEIAGYARIDDAIGYCYQLAGHTFYVLTFPTADKTWVHDITTGLWHEWLWIDTNGEEHRHRSNCFAPVDATLVVGDWQNGNLYALDNRVFTDNGQPIKRVRSFPHILKDGKRVFYRQFLADIDAGTSTAVAPGALTLLDASFTAPDGTTLGDYTSDVGGGWTAIGGEATGEIEDNRLVGSGGDALYQSAATPPTADYSVRYNVVPSSYDTVAADTSLWAIGRASGTGDGYKATVTADGTQYTLTLNVEGGATTASVVMGTLTSGIYTVWLVMRGSTIAAQVQRSQDGLWLRDDGTWQSSSGTTALQFTDTTYTAPGTIMVGGTWP